MAFKKTPQDYPQLSFRISAEDKANIMKLAEQVLEASNQSLPPNEKVFRKNDILVDALYLGLMTLIKKRSKPIIEPTIYSEFTET